MRFKCRSCTATVARVELRIAGQSGPKLHIAFAAGADRPNADALAEAALLGERAELTDDMTTLDFVLAGIEPDNNDPHGAVGVSGIVLGESTLTWLSTIRNSQTQLLIYQRTQLPKEGEGAGTADPDGWAFLTRITETYLGPAPKLVQDIVNQNLPPGGCVQRPSGWSNARFLDYLAAIIGRANRGIGGWLAVNTQNQPLRFISDLGPPLELDELWSVAAACIGRPHTGMTSEAYCILQRPFVPVSPLLLLQSVARFGRPVKPEDAGSVTLNPSEAGKLPALPGPVKWQDKLFYASEVIIVISQKEKKTTTGAETPIPAFHTVVQLRLGQPEPASSALFPVSPELVAARFKSWFPSPGGAAPTLAEAQPDTDGRWALVGMDGKANPELPLLTELLVPVALQEGYAGVYVRRRFGDTLRLLLRMSGPPAALGGPQTCLSEFELRDVTLNGRRVAITTDPATTPVADANGIDIDGEAEKQVIQTGKSILSLSSGNARFTGKVRVDERLDVKPPGD